MIQYINTFEKLRQRAALSLAVLVLALVLFMTFLSHNLYWIQKDVNYLKDYEVGARNSFLELALNIDQGFLNTIEDQWDAMSNNWTTDLRVMQLQNVIVPSILKSAILSIIVVYDNDEIKFTAYADNDYDQYIDQIKQEISYGKDLIILNDEVIDFGEGDRIFLSGRNLSTHDNKRVFIYTGFSEKVRIKDFISTTEICTLDRIHYKTTTVLYGVVGFMFFAILYGMALMMLIRWFILKAMEAFAKKITIGSIAVKKGFLTEEQIKECLQDQNQNILE